MFNYDSISKEIGESPESPGMAKFYKTRLDHYHLLFYQQGREGHNNGQHVVFGKGETRAQGWQKLQYLDLFHYIVQKLDTEKCLFAGTEFENSVEVMFNIFCPCPPAASTYAFLAGIEKGKKPGFIAFDMKTGERVSPPDSTSNSSWYARGDEVPTLSDDFCWSMTDDTVIDETENGDICGAIKTYLAGAGLRVYP